MWHVDNWCQTRRCRRRDTKDLPLAPDITKTETYSFAVLWPYTLT